jgi:hypothetical protein
MAKTFILLVGPSEWPQKSRVAYITILPRRFYFRESFSVTYHNISLSGYLIKNEKKKKIIIACNIFL